LEDKHLQNRRVHATSTVFQMIFNRVTDVEPYMWENGIFYDF